MIYLGADHAGFQLKEAVKKYLDATGRAYQDLGNFQYHQDDDYPDFSYLVANKVSKSSKARGILFCGSSQGACITANKVKGVRAASVRNVAEAVLAREHDDVNIICLAGGRQVQKKFKKVGVPVAEAKKIIKAYLATVFSSAPRHRRRVNKIKRIEKQNFR
ncbi:MAG: RpiB/LacA/LacB family sugar-phosphate isomerase [Candidatus Buchananbacteria bacterium]|nr:RpiB/LacA/LacB family sugar-phosphate isomerase [Candidatus Buchananbacteria bacterium]